MLGICIMPYGNKEAEAEYLTKIATEWGEKRARGQLTHAAAKSLEINIPIGGNHNDKRTMWSNPKTAPGSRTTSHSANKNFPWVVVHGPGMKQGLKFLIYTWSKW